MLRLMPINNGDPGGCNEVALQRYDGVGRWDLLCVLAVDDLAAFGMFDDDVNSLYGRLIVGQPVDVDVRFSGG